MFSQEDATEKLPEVERAKLLLTEAASWSVIKWLREKKTVRKTADKANAALDQLDRDVKQGWPQDLKAAYEAVIAQAAPANGHNSAQAKPADSQILQIARQIKQGDDEAHRARSNAEQTFDDAEKQMSTRLAREGCRLAIESWNLREKAISKSQTLASSA